MNEYNYYGVYRCKLCGEIQRRRDIGASASCVLEVIQILQARLPAGLSHHSCSQDIGNVMGIVAGVSELVAVVRLDNTENPT